MLSFGSSYVNSYLCIRTDKLGVLKVDSDMVRAMSDAMYTGSILISGSINYTLCHMQCRKIGRFHPFIGYKALRESRGLALLYFRPRH